MDNKQHWRCHKQWLPARTNQLFSFNKFVNSTNIWEIHSYQTNAIIQFQIRKRVYGQP